MKRKQVLNYITRNEKDFIITLKDALSNYCLFAYDIEAEASSVANTKVYFITVYKK